MIETVTAIVLDARDYREHDAIVSLLTSSYGILHVVARGIRKLKSKNAGACLPFTLARMQVDIQETKTLHGLRSAEIVESFRLLREDLRKQAIAAFFCECIEKSRFDEDVFELLQEALRYLQQSAHPYRELCLFQAVMNWLHGIEPYVDGCVRCGNTRDVCAISLADGGFVCTNCFHTEQDHKATKSELKTFRLFCKARREHYALLSKLDMVSFQDFENLYGFFAEYAGVSLRSIRFLRTLAAMDIH